MAVVLCMVAIVFLASLCVTLAISLRASNQRLRIVTKQLADNLTRLIRHRQ